MVPVKRLQPPSKPVTEEAHEELDMPGMDVSFDPEDPDPGKLEPDFLAESLSTEFRYSGATEPLISVAEHSVYAARLAQEAGYGLDMQMYALIHDAAEAFTGDMLKPLKSTIEGFDEFEERWDGFIDDFISLETPLEGPDESDEYIVKNIDLELYRDEVVRVLDGMSQENIDGIDFDRDGMDEIPDAKEVTDYGTGIQEAEEMFRQEYDRIYSELMTSKAFEAYSDWIESELTRAYADEAVTS